MYELTSAEYHDMMDGGQGVFKFANGYGASVVRHSFSYGHEEGKFELAVLKGDSLCYDTPVTSDVIGWLSVDDVREILAQIASLPRPTDALSS